MSGICRSRTDPDRKKLKKIKDFLNDNKAWLCEDDCPKADPRCDICTMGFLIKSSYTCNKSYTCKTFIKSYLCEPFMRVEYLYKKHINFDKTKWRTVPEGKKLNLFVCKFFIIKYAGKTNT